MAIARNEVPNASDYIDDAEETPRSRRRDDDDDDERPARKTRARRDDDDDEDDAPVTRKTRTRRDDDDEERPVSRKTRARRDDDEDEDEDADAPSAHSGVFKTGWGQAKKQMDDTAAEYTSEFKFTDDPQVIRFQDGDPIAYMQHWLDKKKGKKSYICIGDKCPLCAEGDRPGPKYAWPIFNFSLEVPTPQLMICGNKLAAKLDKMHSSTRTGPLEERYYAVSKTGQGSSTVWDIEVIKERDLDEDWEIDPDKAEALLSKSETLGPESIQVPSLGDLRAAAAEAF